MRQTVYVLSDKTYRYVCYRLNIDVHLYECWLVALDELKGA